MVHREGLCPDASMQHRRHLGVFIHQQAQQALQR